MRIGLSNCRFCTIDRVCYKLLLLLMNARCTDRLVNTFMYSCMFFKVLKLCNRQNIVYCRDLLFDTLAFLFLMFPT